MSETTRKTRTAQEKAQEVVDKATRKVESLTKRHEKALEDASRLEQELQEAKSERDYAATHPALRETAQAALPLGEADETVSVEEPRQGRPVADAPQA